MCTETFSKGNRIIMADIDDLLRGSDNLKLRQRQEILNISTQFRFLLWKWALNYSIILIDSQNIVV